jgi:hypothetical protein
VWVRRVRLAGVDYLIGRRVNAPAGSRKLSRRELERLLARHRGCAQLRALEVELHSRKPERARHAVRPAASAELVGYELRRPIPRLAPIILSDHQPPRHEPSEPQPMFDEQLHWVEIQLVGEDDGGLAGVVCEVVLANGKTIRRRTDRNGLVRIEGVSTAANCTVTFPELDERAWAPA